MKAYMIIPVYDTVILPDVDYQLGTDPFTEEEKSRIKIDGGKAILLPVKDSIEKKDLKPENFYEIGVLADILEIRETALGTRVHANTRQKIRVTDVSIVDGIGEGSIAEELDEVSDITEKGEKELLESLKKTTSDITENIQGGEMALAYIRNCRSINEYGAMFCQFFDMSRQEKYDLLRTDSLRERGMLIQEALLRFKGTIDMQVEMNRRAEDTEGNAYKKAAIQKQIGLLQQQLEDIDPESAAEEEDRKSVV